MWFQAAATETALHATLGWLPHAHSLAQSHPCPPHPTMFSRLVGLCGFLSGCHKSTLDSRVIFRGIYQSDPERYGVQEASEEHFTNRCGCSQGWGWVEIPHSPLAPR